MGPEQSQITAVIEPVQKAVTTASILTHVKNNRIEYLLAIGLLHLLGVSDRLLAQLNGVCF